VYWPGPPTRRRTRSTPFSSHRPSGRPARWAAPPDSPPASSPCTGTRRSRPRSSIPWPSAEAAGPGRRSPRRAGRKGPEEPIAPGDSLSALHRPPPGVGAAAHRLDVRAGPLGDLVGAEPGVLVEHGDDLGTAGRHGRLRRSLRPLLLLHAGTPFVRTAAHRL